MRILGQIQFLRGCVISPQKKVPPPLPLKKNNSNSLRERVKNALSCTCTVTLILKNIYKEKHHIALKYFFFKSPRNAHILLEGFQIEALQ